jgi:hypothetical protein
MKSMTTDKFYCLCKGPGTRMKVQPSKLPYPAYITCSAIT